MKGKEFESLCRAVDGGEERFVENEELLYTGRVLACERERVVVEAFGRTFRWPKEICEETSSTENSLGPKTSHM